MLEQQINLWDVKDGAICITTNGTVKNNSEAVMGRGCALEASKIFPYIQLVLGKAIKISGNRVFLFNDNYRGTKLITFPVKHNWWEKADIELIKQSCIQLVELMQKNSINKVYLPRPGCGNGKLDWETEVKPAIKDLLPDSVIIVSK